MGYPGTWMTESRSLVYRVVPKCACSTIGQIMFFSDHGRFHAGDIHDATEGLHKWAREESRGPIAEAVETGAGLRFTAVRNPYARILSAFFDKIAGIQRNGRRYREGLLPGLLAEYGVEAGDAFDQIAAFRRFLLFARDTVRFRAPMEPDIHWSSMASHIGTFAANGGRYDRIFHTERFAEGMGGVLDAARTKVAVDLAAVPRFNESDGHGPVRAHPVEDFFDDLAIHLVGEMYRRDFRLFGYGRDPARRAPEGAIDLDLVHSRLA